MITRARYPRAELPRSAFEVLMPPLALWRASAARAQNMRAFDAVVYLPLQRRQQAKVR